MLRELAREGVQPGDRRQVKAVAAARAFAWLHGAEQVEPEHLEVLASVLWDDPQEQLLDFLPTLEGGGFPWLRRVHAASLAGGRRFPDRPTARSPRPVTASPAARMFFAAFTSALTWCPQATHRKRAWLSRLSPAICLQAWQVYDVYAGLTLTTVAPW